MSSWSNGSRGKKLVLLATTSKVLPVFTEDDVFLGNLDSSYNNKQSNDDNESQLNNITNLDSGHSGVVNSK